MGYGYSNRVILHCDLNNFFASVESYFDPSLKDVPMAVCGSTKERHGIVLAKNELAKKFAVKTAEPIWQAKRKCSDLVCVPPHYKWYDIFSKRAREIYMQYTDLVEPFGIDECWLDVTGSALLFGSGEEIAENIRKEIKHQLGVTISVGVSFNKVFAKLGSDLKKPDAVTVINQQNFKNIVWPLPPDALIGVGRSSMKILTKMGIKTIGEVANCSLHTIESQLGKGGLELWQNANGYHNSPVISLKSMPAAKSYSRGVTQAQNLLTEEDVKRTLIPLAESISKQMRRDRVLASTVAISVRDENLITTDRQKRLECPSRVVDTLVRTAMELYRENYKDVGEIRSVTIHATNLVDDSICDQFSLFTDTDRNEKMEIIDSQIDMIRQKYGKNAIKRASSISVNSDAPGFKRQA